MKTSDPLFADIITIMNGTVTVNNQLKLSDKTYEICNKVNSVVNFTINGIKTTSYEYINNTTNLVKNMDEAFERRFLYKVQFKKPNTVLNKNY
mgnify:CR=1 FL=1